MKIKKLHFLIHPSNSVYSLALNVTHCSCNGGPLLLNQYLQRGDFKAGRQSTPLTCHGSKYAKSHKAAFVTKLTLTAIMKHTQRFLFVGLFFKFIRLRKQTSEAQSSKQEEHYI